MEYVVGVFTGIVMGLVIFASNVDPVSKDRMDTIMAACSNNGGVVDAMIYNKSATVCCVDGATFEIDYE